MSIAPGARKKRAWDGPFGHHLSNQGGSMDVYRQTVVKYGVGFGSALAMAVSFTLNKSIFWAIIHGVLGWIYVVYAWLFKTY
jgi:hypothetical protein